MVDLADGSFVDDFKTVEQAEQEAHRARYGKDGKLEPVLFELLETMKPEDEIRVAIWVAGKPQRSELELFAALAARYPEVREAMERSGGDPFALEDPDPDLIKESRRGKMAHL